MTTSVVVDQHWRGLDRRSLMASAQPSDSMSVGAVRVAQLQGMVMAVFGVSASAAVRELQWHSAQLNTSVADLAEDVMGSVSGRRAPITPDVLGALLDGQPTSGLDMGPDPGGRHCPQPLASALHLVETHHPQATQGVVVDAQERWRWERDGLTRREAQVLRLIGEGLPNQDIAATLFVTVNTVKSYIRTAYRKIGVTTRAQAVRWALMHEPPSRNSDSEGQQWPAKRTLKTVTGGPPLRPSERHGQLTIVRHGQSGSNLAHVAAHGASPRPPRPGSL